MYYNFGQQILKEKFEFRGILNLGVQTGSRPNFGNLIRIRPFLNTGSATTVNTKEAITKEIYCF